MILMVTPGTSADFVKKNSRKAGVRTFKFFHLDATQVEGSKLAQMLAQKHCQTAEMA